MTAPTCHTRTRCERLPVQGLCNLDHGQRRTTAGGAMTDVAGSLRLGAERAVVMVAAHPGLANSMHTMWATVDGIGHGRMADRALTDRRCVPLGLNSAQVVIHLITVGAGLVGELGMSRVVAGLALHIAVTGAVAVQALTRHGRVYIRGKARVGPSLERAVRIDGYGLPRAVVVARLTGGHIKPTHACIVADCRHRAMAGLALHDMLTGHICRIAHGAAQALGILARMAVIAGVAGTDTVQGQG